MDGETVMRNTIARGPSDEQGSGWRNAGPDDLMRQTAFLQNRFDLTRAEARLVVHLAKGMSLKSSAKVFGVGYETVRRHLKSAFLKTGTHRQAELLFVIIRALDEMFR